MAGGRDKLTDEWLWASPKFSGGRRRVFSWYTSGQPSQSESHTLRYILRPHETVHKAFSIHNQKKNGNDNYDLVASLWRAKQPKGDYAKFEY